MPPIDTLPEPIVAAHKRMAFGFQRLTDAEATRLLECATAEFHRANNCATAEFRRAERLEQEVLDASAARRRDAEFDRANLAEIARLERENVWLRRQFWGVSIAAVCVIAGLSVALWSCHASP